MQINKANIWQDDFRYALKDIKSVNSFFNLELSDLNFEINIPLNLAYKIRARGPESALWKQFVPTQIESDLVQNNGSQDPIGDQVHAKPGSIVHRYNSRILFFPTTHCPVICRYCFRKNELSDGSDIFDINFSQTLNYISSHPEIEEIIFSGGDPLMLSNSKIEAYLLEFSKIEHIKYIRFHTRSPISMPLRIDKDLVSIFTKYSKIFEVLTIAIHVNHSQEIDEEVSQAIIKLKSITRANIVSQSVLLKGINDKTETLITLFKQLSKLGVIPYYLHHPDLVKGGIHFYVEIETGRMIYANLRSQIPGWMIPTYIYDIPGGHGKQPLFNLETLVFSGKVMNLNQEIIQL